MARSHKNEPLPPDKFRTPKGGVMDKVDVYGWELLDKSGRYQRISKHELQVDHEYQRDNVKWSRVNRIASRWSWVRFGAISVAERPDGTYWVYDGQHRKLAADKRSDIDLLPCIVFRSTGPSDEAKFFLDTNCDRGTLTMLDRFKALVAQEDPVAVAVRDMVEASNYRMQVGGGKNSVRCAGVLLNCMKIDPAATQVAWDTVVKVADREPIIDRAVQGVFVAERHLARVGKESLASSSMAPFVGRLTQKAILKSIATVAGLLNRGGPKVYGEAVVRLLNKGRRASNLIPSLYAEVATDDY